ncbi:penicillin-binding transpeptidase domain-containing protein [Sinomonas mesophila]|uniref:penicillin-binding transpeptidase domain-containing protein n=1 Tax=Sinomonas mesophila TaxID=1531955 RepID=UPI00098438B3|nr:penicillin-binding transpeptidase domain-containing protein [Sinomonas mesophila]
MGKPRALALVLSAALLAGALAACDDGRKAAAQQAVGQLASALSALDVGGVPMRGTEPSAAQAQVEAAVEGLDGAKPAVVAVEPTIDGDRADVVLDYRWTLSGQEWTYSTTASLAREGDRWLAEWRADVLAPQLAAEEVLVLEATAPERAEILGAEDAKLVTSRPVLRVGIDKTKVAAEGQEAAAKALAELVGIDPAVFAQQVAASGERAFAEAIVLRDEPARSPTDEQIAAVPGAVTVKDTLPLAPSRTFARPVLGSVGQATAEQVEASEGALQAGDETGIGGLQAQYDAQLRGKDGLAVYAQPAELTAEALRADPSVRRTLFSADPVPGTPLKTTLDPGLQQLAEDTLAGVGRASALVALRPSDGAVLAAASGPGSNGYNTAMLGQYAPGSIFKTVDSLAIVRAGGSAETRVQCPETLTVDGRTFSNAPGYPASSLGDITLRDAYAHSCNTAFIGQRGAVSQGQLEAAATALGVAVDHPGLGAAAFLGSVPGTADGTEHAASMIGQGRILYSPLAAAIMAGSVAKGSPVSARLVVDLPASAPASPAATGDSASPTAAPSPTASPAPGVTAAEAGVLQGLMRAVVTSGHAGFLAAIPGAPVGAKTGTAEFGADTPPKTHAWIIGTQGDLAVAVFVEEGGFGAEVSGPLLTAFLTAAG